LQKNKPIEIMSLTFLSIIFLLPVALFLSTNLHIAPFKHVSNVLRTTQLAVLISLIGSGFGLFFLANWGPTEITYFSFENLGLTLRLDPLSLIMFTMISIIALVVIRFSKNYLDGEPKIKHFFRKLAFTLAFVQLLVISGNLATLFIAWVGTSIGLHQLLRFYPERKKALLAARKKFFVARMGDASLLTAFILIYLEFNSGNLSYIFAQLKLMSTTSISLQLEIAAILLVLSAALKSVQVPFHGWLLDVMEAPTPVSALLHAGLLNAGPFLIIRFAFLMDVATNASIILISIGAISALFGAIVSTTQPAIKSALAYSSIGHMGFTLMVSGFGVYSASLLHLVAHSFYKAHAFLSAGSVVDKVKTRYAAEFVRLGKPARILLGAGSAIALYGLIAYFWGVNQQSEFQLLAIGAIIFFGVLSLQMNAFDSNNSVRSIVSLLIGSGLVINLFFLLESVVQLGIGSQIPEIKPASASLVTVTFIVLVLFFTTVLIQFISVKLRNGNLSRQLGIHLKNGLYLNLIFDKVMNSLSLKAN
jgi:NAD(P)H-quinone oxidoreductase subunit 5